VPLLVGLSFSLFLRGAEGNSFVVGIEAGRFIEELPFSSTDKHTKL
jgi:hypothetical protein